MNGFLRQFRPAIICFLVMTVICGILYTGVVTGIAQLIFPGQANGSVITVTLKDGTKREYGSRLLAQQFDQPQYMIGRPMTVTNLAPFAAKQADMVRQRINWWRAFDPDNTMDIPIDLVTASGSGADPYISLQAAEFQVNRIAEARSLSPDAVVTIIQKYTSGRFLGFIGEPVVNVLQVNLALDGLI